MKNMQSIFLHTAVCATGVTKAARSSRRLELDYKAAKSLASYMTRNGDWYGR